MSTSSPAPTPERALPGRLVDILAAVCAALGLPLYSIDVMFGDENRPTGLSLHCRGTLSLATARQVFAALHAPHAALSAPFGVEPRLANLVGPVPALGVDLSVLVALDVEEPPDVDLPALVAEVDRLRADDIAGGAR